jgi:hypothetical protein
MTALGYAGSAALGAALAAVMVAASAAGVKVLSRRSKGRPFGPAYAWGPGLRMFAALAGVTLGIAAGPASVSAFVMVFLAAYLAGHAVIRTRFGLS